MMRTTLDIDADVLNAARAMAEAESKSLGSVISRLARSGLAPTTDNTEPGLPHFQVAGDAAPITAAMVRVAIDE
jgi:hypothetical protein